MFTGIISAVAKVQTVESREQERVLTIALPLPDYSDVVLGESIAVNGVCLTVAELGNSTGAKQERVAKFFVSPETCALTNLRSLEPGMSVNLERAMRLQDRLSGHLVQGHVDGLARFAKCRQVGESHEVGVELPEHFLKLVVSKGSIALDGISLTVNSIENSMIYLMIIPHTWEHTTLSTKRLGQDFNVELDVVAKYVSKWTEPYAHHS